MEITGIFRVNLLISLLLLMIMHFCVAEEMVTASFAKKKKKTVNFPPCPHPGRRHLHPDSM